MISPQNIKRRQNFSVLTRGVGDIVFDAQHDFHEKVVVHLEPEDAYRLRGRKEILLSRLPPLEPSSQSARISRTYSTRRGPLVLFSEDVPIDPNNYFGLKSTSQINLSTGELRRTSRPLRHNTQILGHLPYLNQTEDILMSDGDPKKMQQDVALGGLRTLEDLTKSILCFGSRQENDVCMKFVHSNRSHKLVRPGFSARRYIANWARHLDHSIVERLINSGCLSEKTLYQQNAFMPHLKRRINDDLSNSPAPYKIIKQMLISPGPLNEFSFVWNRQQKMKTIEEDNSDSISLLDGDIKLFLNDPEGEVREVEYAELSNEEQKTVLSNLLVKSALNHAVKQMEKQEDSAVHEIDLLPPENTKVTVEDISDNNKHHRSKSKLKGRSPKPALHDMLHAVKDLLDQETSGQLMMITTSLGGGLGGNTPQQIGGDHPFPLPSQKGLRGRPLPTVTSKPPPLPLPTEMNEAQNAFALHGRYLGGGLGLPETMEGNASDMESVSMAAELPFQPVQKIQKQSNHRVTNKRLAMARRTQQKPKGPIEVESGLLKGEDGKIELMYGGILRTEAEKRHVGEQILTLEEKFGEDFAARLRHEPKHGPRHRPYGKYKVGSSTGSQDQSLVTSPTTDNLDIHSGDVDALQSFYSWNYDKQLQAAKEAAARGDLSLLEAHERIHGRGSVLLSESDLVSILSGQAQNVAGTVINMEGGGRDLATDVKEAIQALIRARELDLKKTGEFAHEHANENVSATDGSASVGSWGQEDEYREMIKTALKGVLLNQMSPADQHLLDGLQLSDEVIRQLATGEPITMDNMEVVTDPISGESRLEFKTASHSVTSETAQTNSKTNADGTPSTVIRRPLIPSSSRISGTTSSGIIAGPTPEGGVSGDYSASNEIYQAGVGEGATSASGAIVAREIGSFQSVDNNDDGLEEGQQKKGESSSGTLNRSKSTLKKEREEFIVGKVENKDEIKQLYGKTEEEKLLEYQEIAETIKRRKSVAVNRKGSKPMKKAAAIVPAVGKKKAKKSKKGDAISEEEAIEQKREKIIVNPKPKVIRKEVKAEDGVDGEKGQVGEVTELLEKSLSPNERTAEDSMEINYVDEFGSDDDVLKRSAMKNHHRGSIFSEAASGGGDIGFDEKYLAELEASGNEQDKLQLRKLREAKRQAEAERRRREVELRRRERDEAKKREAQEAELRDQLARELDEAKRQREDEFRQKRAQEAAERQRLLDEEYERDVSLQREKERERLMKEEMMRKMEAMKQKKEEEEARKREEELRRLAELEEERIREEKLLSRMKEADRLEYLRKKAEDEEKRRIAEEEARIRQEEEARIAMETARRLAEEMLAQRRAHDARLRFLTHMHMEHMGLDHDTNITRAFVWSYFDLLSWLGLEEAALNFQKIVDEK